MTNLSKHAMRRCQQRGVTHEMIACVTRHADRESNIGGGCTALEIGREKARRLHSQLGHLAERVRGLVVVMNETGRVVSVVRAHNRRSVRRYRRGMN